MTTSIVALDNYLTPLHELLNDVDVNEIIINKPGVVWVEKKGCFIEQNNSALTFQHLKTLVGLIAQSTHQVIDETQPLLSGTLPR